MAWYDYECVECGGRFEGHHAINASPPDCPTCGGQVKKLFLSAPAMHGNMARGREQAMRSLQTESATAKHAHGPSCKCCHSG